jgi:RNA polymerase sigma factor (sigma-70 family)
MESQGSVTGWLAKLRAGEQGAADELWKRYFDKLVRLARKHLRSLPRLAAEDDVALSAFASFCQGIKRGRFPDLRDRDELWGLLLTITERKAAHLVRKEYRQKRGGGKVIEQAVLAGGKPEGEKQSPLEQIADLDPTPQAAAQTAEELQRLLGLLNAEQQKIAQWKLEGWTNVEIAAELDCALSTIERRLRIIRRSWEEEGNDER